MKCWTNLNAIVLVHRVVFGQDQRHLQHALAVERHPRRAVGLLERAAGRQLGAAVEDADVVEAEEPAREDVAARRILPVDPPVEVQHQALERALQEAQVGPAERPLHLVQVQRRPGVHRRVHVAEIPLVGGNLAVRMEVEAAQHQQQLVLREVEIDQGQRDGMEREIPRRVPRVLPLVRHRDDVGVEHVEPYGVPHAGPHRSEQRVALVLGQPPLEVEVVELLAPQHAGQRLPVDAPLVFVQRRRRDPRVELVGVAEPLVERLGRSRRRRSAGGPRRAAGGWSGSRRPATSSA